MNEVHVQTEPRGYAVAVLQEVDLGPAIWSYMEAIESTFAPFGGEWAIHGTSPHVVEGPSLGDIVMIGFPTMSAAREWYASSEYQEIIPLRADHSEGMVALVEGVPAGYAAAQTVARLQDP